MTHTHVITASIPSHHTLNALRAISGSLYEQNGNGSYSCKIGFYSESDAKDYLSAKANQFFEDDRLDGALEDIQENGCLTIDGVHARIEEVKEEEWEGA